MVRKAGMNRVRLISDPGYPIIIISLSEDGNYRRLQFHSLNGNTG